MQNALKIVQPQDPMQWNQHVYVIQVEKQHKMSANNLDVDYRLINADAIEYRHSVESVSRYEVVI